MEVLEEINFVASKNTRSTTLKEAAAELRSSSQYMLDCWQLVIRN